MSEINKYFQYCKFSHILNVHEVLEISECTKLYMKCEQIKGKIIRTLRNEQKKDYRSVN